MTTINPKQDLILIVDDNTNNLKVLADVLREAGHRVLVANSGESALEKLQQVTPDLILLDVMMPGIDGFETCRRLKASDAMHDIPIIFATALSDSVDRVRGLSLGAVDYITKPIQQEEVLARVNLHLKLHNLTRELEQRVEERTAELQDALNHLKKSQLQLVQSEKMSALGQMMVGIAHEINNPIGFIAGNLTPAQEYARDLLGLLDLYQQHFPDPGADIQSRIEDIDLPYVREDFLKLLTSMREGVDRIRDISHSLRTLARSECDRPCLFNLHDGINSSLMILKHRLKSKEGSVAIDVIKDFNDLPEIECYPGQINQVFINIFSNAIDALEESGMRQPESGVAPTIVIHTEVRRSDHSAGSDGRAEDPSYIFISIADNGPGMSEGTCAKLFEPFFTTKPAGKGTGLGLSISHQIVTERHGGQLICDSVLGQGTKFVIKLPLK